MRYILLLSLTLSLYAQPKPAPPLSEWGKWEMLQPGVLSPDGKWLAYRVNRTNGNHELRVAALGDGKEQTVAFGENPAFSEDSQWLACLIGFDEDQEEKLKKDKKPVRKKLALMKLAAGETAVLENIESFAFSKTGAFLAMRHYGPEKPPAAPAPEGAAPKPADPAGATLVVRILSTGADTTFGNVSGFAWQDKGPLLAMTISAEGKAGNGVQVYDPATGTIRVVDSGAAVYTGLAWRKDSSDLAALRTKTDDRFEDETCVLLAWRNITERLAYDPGSDERFPPGKRIIKSRAPAWSDDGSIVYVGLADWDKKIPPPQKKPDEEPSNVEVWHSRDVNVMSEQKLRAERDRQRHTLAAWHPGAGGLLQLSSNWKEEMTPARKRPVAIALDPTPHQTDDMFGRRYRDVYNIDVVTGARTRLAERITHPFGASPTGRYFLYFKDNHHWVSDLTAAAHRSLTKGLAASFVDADDDHPAPQKRPNGVAGWTRDDGSVIVYDQYDLWELFPDGRQPARLTSGAADQVQHRYLKLDPDEEFIDTRKPMYLRLAGRRTKASGIARLAGGKVDRLVYRDRRITNLAKAKNAEVYAWIEGAFDDPPDYFTAGPDLRDARQASRINPFQGQYAWGRAERIEYQNTGGRRLEGALFYPAGYQPGKRYPMIVNIYERLSDSLHNYFPLSERSPYSAAVYTSLGYFVLMPDIVFRKRDPGVSAVECVVPAVKKVIEGGMVDPQRIGLMGHSWGGYGTAFIVTQTDLFAAAVSGAPLTNLVSSYGEIYWNTGIPETNHAETGQERMEVPLWEDPQAYIRNSGVFFVNRMKTPLLLAVGDKDGASDWHQDLEMYNLARRAGRQCVLLVYPGENHSLRVKANQLDYQRRIREWFGHYLKGEPAGPWISSGVSFLDREKELKRLKEAKPAAERGS